MSRVLAFSALISALSIATSAHAKTAAALHQATQFEATQAIEANTLSKQGARVLTEPMAAQNFQPVADTAQFGYVLMNGDTEDSDEVATLRQTIAQNLPVPVKLVILTDSSRASTIRAQYLKWISADRLIVAITNDENVDNGFWARDSFPVPVVNPAGAVSLVAANYFRPFNSAAALDKAVGSPAMTRPTITFVGGDLLADAKGVCFSVAGSREFGLTAAQIQNTYGCKQLHIMPHVAGLGDVDEVLKPLSPTLMLTNRTEYQAQLQSWGYQVVMLPDLPGYRTYANSLIVQKTAFVPAYGVPEDAVAQQVYKNLGYTVFPISSVYLSDELWGSIHCQTMAYPQMSKTSLLNLIGAHVLQ